MSEKASHLNGEQLYLFDQPSPEVIAQQAVPYELIVGHETTDGVFKTTEQVQCEYIRLTDELIHKAVDGVEAYNPRTKEQTTETVDYFIWLDKSARPLSWMTKALWPQLARRADGTLPDMPESKFVNIDRNQWTSAIDPQGVGSTDISKIDASIVRSLRSIFLTHSSSREQGLTEAIDDAPTIFDGKTIMIVDEVQSTGRTLTYASKFFARAFPDAKIAGAHWMAGITTKNGAVGNKDIPVWYSDTTDLGRGIGNRNIDASLASENQTQRLGAFFLSTALRKPDEKSIQLRAEIQQLAHDAAAGKLLIVPSLKRDAEDFDERAVRLNGVQDFKAFIAAKQRLDTTGSAQITA